MNRFNNFMFYYRVRRMRLQFSRCAIVLHSSIKKMDEDAEFLGTQSSPNIVSMATQSVALEGSYSHAVCVSGSPVTHTYVPTWTESVKPIQLAKRAHHLPDVNIFAGAGDGDQVSCLASAALGQPRSVSHRL